MYFSYYLTLMFAHKKMFAHKIGKHELRKLILSGPKVHEQSHTIINFEVSHSISRKKGMNLCTLKRGNL